MVQKVGLEPTLDWIKTSCLTIWPLLIDLAPEVGLEPTTCRLTVGCSTIELLWIILAD